MFATDIAAAIQSSGGKNNNSSGPIGWYKKQKPFVRFALPVVAFVLLAKIILPLLFSPPAPVSAESGKQEIVNIALKDTAQVEEQPPLDAVQIPSQPAEVQPIREEEQMNEEEQYLLNRKRVLVNTIPPGSISVDILGVENQVLISGSPYIQGAIIKDGFRVSLIKVLPGERIEDIKFEIEFSDVKSEKVVKKSLVLLSDHYSVLYYEGGLEIKAKKSARTSGVVLAGENISSAFKFTRIKETEAGNIYCLLLPDGTEMEAFVPISEINI